MAISTKISITIDGKTLTRFSKLVINQKVNAHHTFSILQPLPKEFINQAIDKAQSYIGKKIKIEIAPNNLKTTSPLLFHGIIAEAQMVRASGASGGIIINGFSPTIALEGIPKTKSFSDESLSDIVRTVTDNYAQFNLRPTINTKSKDTLSYTVQYKESDFSFICRLAQKKGEWIYYNGEELIFGSPKSKNFNLEYGRSLHNFNIEMRAKPLGLEYLGYDPSNSETQKANTTEINHQPNGYARVMFETSKKLFSEITPMLYTHAIEEGSARMHLTDRVSTQLYARASDLVTVKGDSDETGLRIGDVVSIHEPSFTMTGNLADSIQEQNFGSYIITDITHVCEESGSYHNTFQGVPDSVLAPPYTNVHNHPFADTQTATVTDNNDPLGLGRVQVKFVWQEKNTPWIRMTNPHSGGGKGVYFVPEIGEEVLVGFEAGNAEKPFVIGTMYNGNESSGFATAENDFKVIKTRSGHHLTFEELKNIILSDAKGNFFHIDSQGSNLNITALETVTINCKNFVVNVAENMSTTVGKDTIENTSNNKTTIVGKDNAMNIGANNSVNVLGEMNEFIKGDFNSHTEKERILSAEKQIESTSKGAITKHAQSEVLNKSGEQAKGH